jgi:peptide methionine sulfoxide reductase MsrA
LKRISELETFGYEGKVMKMKEIEAILSKYNSKTCNTNKFAEYIKIKTKINEILKEQYEEEVYSLFKLYGYINKQKSEDKMLNDFGKKYRKEAIVIIGDYGENKSMKEK